MEPIAVDSADAAEAAFQAYRAARRAHASRSTADDVALARFRAYFPLATESECRSSIRMHLAAKRMARVAAPSHERPRTLVLAMWH